MWSIIKFVLIPLMVCAVLGLYTPSWCWYKCPELGTSSIDWFQLSIILPEDGDRVQSNKRCFQIKNCSMDNA
jgi:hypothetical protein